MGFWRELGIMHSREEIQEKYDNYFRSLMPQPIDWVQYVLDELCKQGKELFVLSTHPQEFLDREVKAYGFDIFIEPKNVFGSVYRKGDFLKEKGFNPGHSLFIGDTYGDLIAGNEAGIKAVGVLTRYNNWEKLEPYADYIMNNLTELQILL